MSNSQMNSRTIPLYRPTNARLRPELGQNSDTAQIVNTTRNRPDFRSISRLNWDTQADTFSMTAHRAGQTVTEISRLLARNGYNAPRTEVAASLHRQGAKKVGWVPSAAIPPIRWDAQADTFALAAHRAGKTAGQIHTQLTRNGYTTTIPQVSARLYGMGVQKVHWRPEHVTTIAWDAQADTFALAAHRVGQTMWQISAQLIKNGYAVTTTEVMASLARQGVVLSAPGHDSGR